MNITLLIIILCIVMSAYFSATETAFSSLNRIRIKNMADKGNKRAALVLKLSSDYDRLLSTILIGNNIVNIASASLSTLLFVRFLGEDMGASVSTAVTTVVVLIFGEVSPKSIAKEAPESFAMFSAPLLNGFALLLTPLNFLFKQWKKVLSRLFGTASNQTITEEELITIVEEAQQGGGIDSQEGELLRNAIEFNELKAADILTPRIDITGISADASPEKIASVFAATGFSRLPVYQGSIDNITGILYQKDFYNSVYGTDKAIESIIRPALYITRHRKISLLLKELQASKLHIAVVIDEFGGTVGIVTLEDILEEIVGEIHDEYDENEEDFIKEIGEREYMIEGSTNLDDLNDRLDLQLESEDYDSLGGFIIEHLDRLPEEGDSITTEDGLRLVVESLDKNRIESVHAYLPEPSVETEDDDSDN